MRSAQYPTQNGNQHGVQAIYEPIDPIKEGESFLTHSIRPPTEPKSCSTWFLVLWPLLLHAILTIIIVTFMLAYVDGGNFNISERRPTVRLHDGTTVPWISFAPLQSDITTFVSVSIAILRLVAASWLGSLCWRCAFILMAEYGLRPQQLRNLISYSIPTVNLNRETTSPKVTPWLLWAIPIITIPVQLAAPILTGSITWVPKHHPPRYLSNSTVTTRLYDGEVTYWLQWQLEFAYRLQTARFAASLTFLTWGRETHTSALRRFLPGLELEANSTLTNVTIPYFSIRSIEWVNDPEGTLSVEQLDIKNVVCRRIGPASDTKNYCPLSFGGGLTLIPDIPWYNLTLPRPAVISERRLMVANVGYFSNDTRHCNLMLGLDEIGPDRTIYINSYYCYVFAWVTYTAGSATCYNCPISSFGTIQNNTALSVQPDYLTETAMTYAADATELMREMMDQIGMAPTWNGLDDYIAGTLTRSYAGSWMALAESWGERDRFNTTYSLSVPASQALVNIPRVYIWLGLQSLVTISGVLFLYVQSRTSTPIIAEIPLAPFYLDTSVVQNCNGDYRTPVVGRVELEGDRLKFKAE